MVLFAVSALLLSTSPYQASGVGVRVTPSLSIGSRSSTNGRTISTNGGEGGNTSSEGGSKGSEGGIRAGSSPGANRGRQWGSILGGIPVARRSDDARDVTPATKRSDSDRRGTVWWCREQLGGVNVPTIDRTDMRKGLYVPCSALSTWVHTKQAALPRKGVVVRALPAARAAVVSAGSGRDSQEHPRRRSGMGWSRVRRNHGATATIRASVEEEGKGFTPSKSGAGASACDKASPRPKDMGVAVAATAVGVPSKLSGTASPSPGPSYLQWRSREEAEGASLDEAEEKRLGKKEVSSLSKTSGGGPADDSEGDMNSPKGKSLEAAKASRGGAAAVSLSFSEAMLAGAVSRSIAQTCMQPANVVKTLLQGRGTSSQLSNLSFKLLTRGAGAQFVMSLPHGAFNYATLEVRVIAMHRYP